MYNSTDIAKRIKSRAKEQGLLLKDMLELLGINRNTLTNMYNGSMPAADTLAKIAVALNCSVDYLLGNDDKEINFIQNDISLSPKRRKILEATLNLSEDDLKKVIEYAELLKLKGNQ